MGDYFPLKDPNWGEINIWGATPEIEALSWIEKRNYLKATFASDGVLVSMYKGGKSLLGEDAELIHSLIADCPGAFDWTYRQTEYGPLLQFSARGWLTGYIQEHGIAVYQYFVGTANRTNHQEMWGWDDFLSPPDHQAAEPAAQQPAEPLVQLSLF